jgi:integrase
MQWAVAQGASEVKALPKAKPKRRLREAKSFDDGDWKRLRATLKTSNDDCDRVLYVILMTGLRVGDVLRTPRSEIDKALRTQILEVERKGGTFVQVPIAGLEDAWTALRDEMRRIRAPTVAAFICPTNPSPEAGDAAYKALSRRLLDLGRELGVTGRIHIHRFRRTIAVRGLAVTADTGAVQQLLSRNHHSSTLHRRNPRRCSVKDEKAHPR